MSAEETAANEAAETTADTGESTDRSRDDSPPDERSLSNLTREELTLLVEELQSENRRLREEYTRARRSSYRRSAIVLAILGVLGTLAGFAFPVGREVLFILGATGLFGGVLTWYLTPEDLITATVGQSVYESVAATGDGLRAELGLEETTVYVPTPGTDPADAPVKLFVPQSRAYDVPEPDDLGSLFVLPESPARRGIAVQPTAARLIEEFEKSTGDDVAAKPEPLGEQLADALVEQFELVDSAVSEIDPESNRLTFGIDGSVYEDELGFDHPVTSFLGTGVAYGLDEPVSVETTESDGQTLVTCRWETRNADESESAETKQQ